jgi:hypothetical protein
MRALDGRAFDDDLDVWRRQRAHVTECPLEVSTEEGAGVVAVRRGAGAAQRISSADGALLVQPLVERRAVHHGASVHHRRVREHGQLPRDGVDQVDVRLRRIVATWPRHVRVEQHDFDLAGSLRALVCHDAFEQRQAARPDPDDADTRFFHRDSLRFDWRDWFRSQSARPCIALTTARPLRCATPRHGVRANVSNAVSCRRRGRGV